MIMSKIKHYYWNELEKPDDGTDEKKTFFFAIRNDICVEGAIAEAIEDGEVFDTYEAALDRAYNMTAQILEHTSIENAIMPPLYTVVEGTSQEDHGTPWNWIGYGEQAVYKVPVVKKKKSTYDNIFEWLEKQGVLI